MRTLKLATLVLVATLSPGCALLNAVRTGNPNAIANAAVSEGAALAKLTPEAKAYAEDKCKSILSQEVGFDEERAIGGAVGVSLISKSGHLFLDGITEKNPTKLNEALAAKKTVVLPDSAINDLTAYVSVVGKNLARYSARPDLPWTFAVIQNEAVNAFSAPGGYVVVTTALLKKVTNEAQLAGVLAHEVGHVVHKHSLTKYRDGKNKQCIAANFAGYMIEHGGPVNPATQVAASYAKKFDGKMDLDGSDGKFIIFLMDGVITLLQLGNDKEAEFLTDKTALELVAFAGYDAVEYEKFLASLGSQGGGVLSSHPSTDERVAKLKALREGELKDFATGTAKPDVSKALAALKLAK
jgi:predicted Zn-dependent protease